MSMSAGCEEPQLAQHAGCVQEVRQGSSGS